MRSERDPRGLRRRAGASARRRATSPCRPRAGRSIDAAAVPRDGVPARPESQLIQLDAATFEEDPLRGVDLEDALWQRPAKKWWRPPQPCVYCDLLRRGTTKAESPGQVESVPRPAARGAGARVARRRPARAVLFALLARLLGQRVRARVGAAVAAAVADAVAEPRRPGVPARLQVRVRLLQDAAVNDERAAGRCESRSRRRRPSCCRASPRTTRSKGERVGRPRRGPRVPGRFFAREAVGLQGDLAEPTWPRALARRRRVRTRAATPSGSSRRPRARLPTVSELALQHGRVALAAAGLAGPDEGAPSWTRRSCLH